MGAGTTSRVIVAVLALACTHQTVAAQDSTIKSGWDVIQAMHTRYARTWYSTLTFTQSTVRRTARDSIVRELWYESIKLPGRLRIEIGAQDGQRVILFAKDSTFARFPNYPIHRTAGRNPLLILGFDVYKQSVERTYGVLHAEGFDFTKFRVDTLNGKAMYVVGAATGDSISKQFWVECDRLLFMRMLEPGQRPGALSDVRFDDYKPLAKGWIAMHVTATEEGRIMQDEFYSDVKVDVPLPDSLFDPAALK